MIGWLILLGIVVGFLIGASKATDHIPDEFVWDLYYDEEEDEDAKL